MIRAPLPFPVHRAKFHSLIVYQNVPSTPDRYAIDPASALQMYQFHPIAPPISLTAQRYLANPCFPYDVRLVRLC